jgi:hypothetical protein
MQTRDWLVIISVLVLMMAGILLPEQIENFLAAVRSSLLPEITEWTPSESEEPLEITLPELSEEVSEEEEPEFLMGEEPLLSEEPEEEEIFAPEGPSELLFPKESKPRLSLADIQERVGEIKQETEAVSERVEEIVEASAKTRVAGKVWEPPSQEAEREAKMAEIQEQINNISEKITVLSQRLSEMLETPDINA